MYKIERLDKKKIHMEKWTKLKLDKLNKMKSFDKTDNQNSLI